ncbi:MAG TPA: hypothetical protein VFZ78_11020 [Flavisolibacter sp.]
MKKLIPVLCILLAASGSRAQVISGLYTALLVNDSTKVVQRYELALSEYRGKITGYSYTTFVRNDSLFYSVKQVKGTRKDQQLIIEDVKMLAYKFPEERSRGVRQVNTIALTDEDTLRTASGNWHTTRTKVYYSIGGTSTFERTEDSSALALIMHLKELEFARTGAAAQPSKPAAKNSAKSVAKNTTKGTVKNAAPVAAPVVILPQQDRATQVLHQLTTSADSLVLSFFDNGVIDGDSVSVIVNGETVISKRKLTDRAVKHTVTIPKNSAEVRVLLVAESLGSLPPNTGLLIIDDGDKRYQLSFSADFSTNAAIVINRRP